jgi:quercetin dioxygenase-like cupin family protein
MSKGIEPSTTYETAALVDYQDGSIVSRVLLKASGGNVTLFAFDEGQALSEHSAPYDALVFVVDGVAEIRIAGEPHRVSAGETILLPANVSHAVEAVQRFKMILTMVRTQV